MPRFSVPFSKRKSAANAEEDYDAVLSAPSTFRVLERSEVGGSPGDGGARVSRGFHVLPPRTASTEAEDDSNMFAGLKVTNRGSGSSNTTKTVSTDNSSRHSNLSSSTAPSSADLATHQEEGRTAQQKPYGDIPIPPIPKSSSGFLSRAGRTLSFGSQKKVAPPTDDSYRPPSQWQEDEEEGEYSARSRAATASTTSTAIPPKIEVANTMDLGGDFGTMFTGFDKRSSVATLRNDASRHAASTPRSLTSTRDLHPTPITVDRSAKIESSPYSFSSQHSSDNLLSPSPTGRDRPPPVPRHGTPLTSTSENGVEYSSLAKDSLLASKWLSNPSAATRGRSKEESYPLAELKSSRTNTRADDDNMFSDSIAMSSRVAQRFVARAPSPPRNKVMTPAQFERYRQDKERQGTLKSSDKAVAPENDEDDDDNYEDDDDELEKSKQAAKQRRKQEAHLTVYRQRMMKVTGETPAMNSMGRPGMPVSMSAPSLNVKGPSPEPPLGVSDGSDEDEEVPLAILQAHGFPSKARPPTRSGQVSSNMRASMAPSVVLPSRPQTSSGDGNGGGRHSMLPAFARNLPQDPFGGQQQSRNSMAMGASIPTTQTPPPQPQPQGPLPIGGLVGVIANEERNRAMRRASPNGTPGLKQSTSFPMPSMTPQGYGMNAAATVSQPALSAGDQVQLQMSQQMQQFMQMQMQFMQMMATQNQGGMPPQQMPPMPGMAPMDGPNGSMLMPGMPDMAMRHSYAGDLAPEPPPHLNPQMRTMSMVQPSSASWIQPAGYAPSIRAQGAGYAPSIAPSERSNIGLPGRYRPVSQAPPPMPLDPTRRASTVSGAIPTMQKIERKPVASMAPTNGGSASDDDDDEGWEAMKAKREKKKSMWRLKKTTSIMGMI